MSTTRGREWSCEAPADTHALFPCRAFFVVVVLVFFRRVLLMRFGCAAVYGDVVGGMQTVQCSIPLTFAGAGAAQPRRWSQEGAV